MSSLRTSLIGALLIALGPVSMALYTPAMPELVEAFGTTESMIKLSLSVYFIGFACAQLLSGPASDAFGRRQASLFFLAIYLAGSIGAAAAPSVEALLVARLVQGMGASVGVTVSRAIVRDQFTGAEASRLLNMIGIMLAVGPALGPTLGGLALALFDWRAVFLLMVIFGAASAAVVFFFMPETSRPDPALIRPVRLAKAYGTLAGDLRVLSSALVLAGIVGALYAQSTMLPFILINRVGLTPVAFGLGMLMQTGSYFAGSVALRLVSPRLPPGWAVRIGLVLTVTGGAAIFLSTRLVEPSFLSIMLPVAFCSFGMAFVIPDITTAGLTPYPHFAGTAAALMGFIQMGSGFLGGAAAAWIGDPLSAFGLIIPTMELVALLAYVIFTAAWAKAAS
ncbi:multidrug effflux MFS transporter [Rhizobium sp. TRM95796]|uniref:multidrug effflux MFS transporter n=1 Tax=Rhizobium sp. TRM95796 TaxID=2979862 RepID=UPI003994CE02|nr:multidrug effflux MFS transporter [Rhizobium sp. TRM95796]